MFVYFLYKLTIKNSTKDSPSGDDSQGEEDSDSTPNEDDEHIETTLDTIMGSVYGREDTH